MNKSHVVFTLPQVRVPVSDETDAAIRAWERVKDKTLNELFGEHKESIRVSLVQEARLGGSDEKLSAASDA